MPQISETPAGSRAGASWNSLVGASKKSFTLNEQGPQAIPPMIALHIGEAELIRLAMGGDDE